LQKGASEKLIGHVSLTYSNSKIQLVYLFIVAICSFKIVLKKGDDLLFKGVDYLQTKAILLKGLSKIE